MKNPFKNFIPFRLAPKAGGDVREILDFHGDAIFEPFETSDPTGGTWRTLGFQRIEGEFLHDLDGAGDVLDVQFNERILPAKVRDEHLAQRIAAITEREGRKPGKKEYAELRDEVEFDLLPKSHIRRTNVYVMILKGNTTLVFTSSVKKATDAMSLILHAIGRHEEVSITPIEPKNDIPSYLTSVVTTNNVDEFPFEDADAAVLKKSKEVIRIKDTDLSDAQIQSMLREDGFAVHELSMTFFVEAEPVMDFTLNDKFVFKRCVLPDAKVVEKTDKTEDGNVAFHSLAWLVATEYRSLLKTVIDELGGEHLHTAKAEPKKQAQDEEDEL